MESLGMGRVIIGQSLSYEEERRHGSSRLPQIRCIHLEMEANEVCIACIVNWYWFEGIILGRERVGHIGALEMEGMEVQNTKRGLSGWLSMEGCCETGMKRWEIGAYVLEKMRDIRYNRIELKRCHLRT